MKYKLFRVNSRPFNDERVGCYYQVFAVPEPIRYGPCTCPCRHAGTANGSCYDSRGRTIEELDFFRLRAEGDFDWRRGT
jgi:hypothetical protein